MSVSDLITRVIDLFYVRPVAVLLSRQTFRYAACGMLTLTLDAMWYAVFYNFAFDRINFDLGFIVISPHIAALILVFPITFFTGFWLNSHVAFRSSPFETRIQLMRYALSVVGSFLLNYVCIKLFVEVWSIWPTPSKILTSLISVIYSFLAAKYFTFRNTLD